MARRRWAVALVALLLVCALHGAHGADFYADGATANTDTCDVGSPCTLAAAIALATTPGDRVFTTVSVFTISSDVTVPAGVLLGASTPVDVHAPSTPQTEFSCAGGSVILSTDAVLQNLLVTTDGSPTAHCVVVRDAGTGTGVVIKNLEMRRTADTFNNALLKLDSSGSYDSAKVNVVGVLIKSQAGTSNDADIDFTSAPTGVATFVFYDVRVTNQAGGSLSVYRPAVRVTGAKSLTTGDDADGTDAYFAFEGLAYFSAQMSNTPSGGAWLIDDFRAQKGNLVATNLRKLSSAIVFSSMLVTDANYPPLHLAAAVEGSYADAKTNAPDVEVTAATITFDTTAMSARSLVNRACWLFNTFTQDYSEAFQRFGAITIGSTSTCTAKTQSVATGAFANMTAVRLGDATSATVQLAYNLLGVTIDGNSFLGHVVHRYDHGAVCGEELSGASADAPLVVTLSSNGAAIASVPPNAGFASVLRGDYEGVCFGLPLKFNVNTNSASFDLYKLVSGTEPDGKIVTVGAGMDGDVLSEIGRAYYGATTGPQYTMNGVTLGAGAVVNGYVRMPQGFTHNASYTAEAFDDAYFQPEAEYTSNGFDGAWSTFTADVCAYSPLAVFDAETYSVFVADTAKTAGVELRVTADVFELYKVISGSPSERLAWADLALSTVTEADLQLCTYTLTVTGTVHVCPYVRVFKYSTGASATSQTVAGADSANFGKWIRLFGTECYDTGIATSTFDAYKVRWTGPAGSPSNMVMKRYLVASEVDREGVAFAPSEQAAPVGSPGSAPAVREWPRSLRAACLA